ncbi:MAG: hypothetical protein MZV49_04805 [Rhodopseudomonas palustris]|nr:hypothetical protein [Rhodopseudomonas palustris]
MLYAVYGGLRSTSDIPFEENQIALLVGVGFVAIFMVALIMAMIAHRMSRLSAELEEKEQGDPRADGAEERDRRRHAELSHHHRS